MMAQIGFWILAALIGWIIFSLVIFPAVLMFVFALPYILPYLLLIGGIYFLWKYLRK